LTEQAIQERAYAISKEEGCLNGEEFERWLRAEAEVNSVEENTRE
jgi:hypothetical protein